MSCLRLFFSHMMVEELTVYEVKAFCFTKEWKFASYSKKRAVGLFSITCIDWKKSSKIKVIQWCNNSTCWTLFLGEGRPSWFSSKVNLCTTVSNKIQVNGERKTKCNNKNYYIYYNKNHRHVCTRLCTRKSAPKQILFIDRYISL